MRTTEELVTAEQDHRRHLDEVRASAAAQRDQLDREVERARDRVADLIAEGHSPTGSWLSQAWDHWVVAQARYNAAVDAHLAAFRAWEQAR